jgi:hypothetical protein
VDALKGWLVCWRVGGRVRALGERVQRSAGCIGWLADALEKERQDGEPELVDDMAEHWRARQREDDMDGAPSHTDTGNKVGPLSLWFCVRGSAAAAAAA